MSSEGLIYILGITAVFSVLALTALIYFSNSRHSFNRFLLVVITASLPILSYAEQSSTSGPSASFFAVNICLADLFLPVAVIYLIIRKLNDHSKIELPFAWFFWFYFLWVAISLYAGIHNYRLELFKFSNFVSLVKVLILVFYLWCIVNLLESFDDMRLFAKIWIIAGLFNALLGILGSLAYLFFGVESFLSGAFRAHGTMGNPNNFAGYMVTVFFVSIMYLELGGRKSLGVLSLILSAAGIVASASKGALGAWLGGCFLLALFIRRFRLKAITAVMAMGIIIVGMYYASDATRVYADRLLLQDKEGATYESSLMSRVSLWLASLNIWQENIIFGIGKGNFGKVSEGTEQNEEMQEANKAKGLDDVEIETTVSHSTYISLLSETGLVGFLLFMGFMLYFILKLLLSMLKLSPGIPKYHVRAALLSAILAILAQGLFANVEDSRHLWVLLGATLVVFEKSDEWSWHPGPAVSI